MYVGCGGGSKDENSFKHSTTHAQVTIIEFLLDKISKFKGVIYEGENYFGEKYFNMEKNTHLKIFYFLLEKNSS